MHFFTMNFFLFNTNFLSFFFIQEEGSMGRGDGPFFFSFTILTKTFQGYLTQVNYGDLLCLYIYCIVFDFLLAYN